MYYIDLKLQPLCHEILYYVSDDHSRVVLEEDPTEPDSDYINANFIDVSNFRLPSVNGLKNDVK